MNKQVIKRTAVCAALAMLLLLVQLPGLAAAELDAPAVDYALGTLTISGSLGNGNSGMRVGYAVTDAAGRTVYMNQGFAGQGGFFKDVSPLSGLYTGGNYTVRVTATGQDAPLEAVFAVDRSRETVYAEEVKILGADEAGAIREGGTLTGAYQFFSSFGQEEGDSRYTWSLGPAKDGPFPYVLPGADGKSYTFQTADILEIVRQHEAEFQAHTYYVQFAVEPRSKGADTYAERAESAGAVQVIAAPSAAEVTAKGSGNVGAKLQGGYAFYDLADRKESGSIYAWLSCATAGGTYRRHAEGLSYTVSSRDRGLYFKFEVTPVTADGTKGAPVVSQNSIYIREESGGSSGGGGGGGGSVSGGRPGGAGETVVSGTGIPDTAVAPNQPESVPGEFADVPAGHWAKTVIRDVVLRGDAQGVGADRFEPERSITRAEFAKLVVSTLDLPEAVYAGGFADVSADDWYADTVQTVAEREIMRGFEDRFEPEAAITREEMAKVIADAYFAAGGVREEAAALGFSDADTISEWAAEAVAQAAGLGLINGLPDGSFAPRAEATRAEAAAMTDRLYRSLLVKDTEVRG